MIDTVSIIVAVISLVSAIASAACTGYITFYIDKVKRRSEARALTDKYRDPLTLSAYDLQSRFYNIIKNRLLLRLPDSPRGELKRVYTSFVIGQYFAWVFIFRREAQFLRFSTDATNKQLSGIMERIMEDFASGEDSHEGAFTLWRAEQMAIGEVMTEQDQNGQLYCIGYAKFALKYARDETFRRWFAPVEHAIDLISEAEKPGNKVGNIFTKDRMRRLQHLLVDLMSVTGEGLQAQAPYRIRKVRAARGWRCSGC